MNLGVPPWMADFRLSAALDFFPRRFPGLWGGWFFYLLTFSEISGRGVFCSVSFWFVFDFLGLGWGWFLRILSCLPPPLSVGAGLGNRATHLWHRRRFQSCGLGLGGSWRIPCHVSYRLSYSLFAIP